MAAVRRLAHDFTLTPVIATEIEFYLHGAGGVFSPDEVLESIRSVCKQSGIVLASAEVERGHDQYEIALAPTRDVQALITDTERFKALMAETFAPRQVRADFSAKPFSDQPGSGLHVHLHLEDEAGRNVFFREGEAFSPLLLHAIGGLLALMNPCMVYFAPREESYARFAAGSNAPTTVSWGTNNRTVAVRLPTKPLDHKHIEHRVAGSDAVVGDVIEAILLGAHYGLMQSCDPGEPIYGDAALAQYAKAKLVGSLSEAQRFRRDCTALDGYLAGV